MPDPFFIKLILSTTQHKKLRIPDDFVTKFGGELPVAAALTGPDGRVWHVGIRIVESKVWFQDGWEEFVEGYHIRVGCILVFRYEGKSCFFVSIFNLYNSEIDYQVNALVGTQYNHRKQYPFEELEDDESISPELQNLFAETKLNDCINRSREIGFQISQGTHNQSFRGAELPEPKKSRRKKQKLDHHKQDSSAGHEEAKVEKRFRFYASASARKRTVTAEEREKTVNTAKSLEPLNPFCRVVLRPSYVYRGCIMYLPSGFAEKYLSGVPDFIKLQVPDGRQWPVRCLYRPLYRGGRAKFIQGWYEFASENNLCEGDVCIFELLRSKEFVLKVTIFRVSENAGLMHQS